MKLSPSALQQLIENHQTDFNQMVEESKKLADKIFDERSNATGKVFSLYQLWIDNDVDEGIDAYYYFQHSEFYKLFRKIITDIPGFDASKVSDFQIFKIFVKGYDNVDYFNSAYVENSFNTLLSKQIEELTFNYTGIFNSDELTSGNKPPYSNKNLLEISGITLDMEHFYQIHEAMFKASENLGGHFFVSGYEEKKNHLQKIIREYTEHMKERKWEKAFEKSIEFVKLSSTPRGGFLNFHKANYGETHSAKAFYTCLQHYELDEMMTLIKDKAKPEQDNQSEISLQH